MALNLTDNWQMAKILTDNWHLYPPPPLTHPDPQWTTQVVSIYTATNLTKATRQNFLQI